MRKMVAVVTLSVGASALTFAHVELRPQVSTPGADQQYTVRAHNEGKVAVTSLMLDVPSDVTVTDVAKPAVGSYDVKNEGNRIVSITWSRDIKPETFADFRFTAKNPTKGTDIQWHTREQMADGTAIDWGGTTSGAKKGPVTRLDVAGAKPAATPEHDHEHQH